VTFTNNWSSNGNKYLIGDVIPWILAAGASKTAPFILSRTHFGLKEAAIIKAVVPMEWPTQDSWSCLVVFKM